MKICNHLVLVFSIFLLSCTDENVTTRPIQRIESIGLFDVGNDGNVSDMSVSFSIQNVADINQFNVLVIPSNLSKSFTKEQALLVTGDRFVTVELTGGEDYTVQLKEILDIEGNPIVNNKGYVARILMIGEQFNQLSMIESNRLSLIDQGIYNGYYEGAVLHNISNGQRLTETTNGIIRLKGTFSESSLTAGLYFGDFETEIANGQFRAPTTGSTSIKFTAGDNGNIFGFDVVSGSLSSYANTFTDCKQLNTGEFSASVRNIVRLEFNGENCEPGKFEMTLIRSFQDNGN